MRRYLALALLALLPAGRLVAETGVLIPWSMSTKPNPDILAMRSMDVRVVIEDLHAEVHIDQIFENRTDQALEGKYVLPLGEQATLTDFSLWEGDSRRIGAIIDKQRGRQLYEEITRQNIDPGLMETGDEEEAGVFSLRVSPIPAYGTTRVTLTYEQELEMGSLATQWTLPLKPRRYGAQSVGEFSLSIEVRGGSPIADARLAPAAWFAKQQPKAGDAGFKLSYKGKDVNLADDVQIGWRIDAPQGGAVGRLYAYRDVRPRKDRSPFGGATYVDETGFFLARGVFASKAAMDADAKPVRPRDVVILLDTSLSMQWEKMDVAIGALGEFLRTRLTAEDRFSVIAFNDEVRPLSTALLAAGSENTDKALGFVRQSYLAGGTDLRGALAKAGELLGAGKRDNADRDVLLITDGHPTWGEIDLKKLTAGAKTALGTGRLFVLGIGDDVNGTLLRSLAAAVDGAYTVVPEGGDASFILDTFFDKLGRPVYRDVKLTLPDNAEITQVYPVHAAAFDGSAVAFFGRYAKPQPKGEGTIAAVVDGGTTSGTTGGAPVSAKFTAALGEKETEREYVARGWAARRIEDLLDRIRTEGEKDEWVSEIVALSKRFHVVTPYTSFIAAPRAMLRPRNFQAGDPVLRVKTGPDIVGVTAIFPFGLTKALDYVAEEDVWETRFLAPVTMTDGSYECTLVLTDTAGRHLRESKSFTVDSQPPEVEVEPAAGAVRPGDRLRLTAHADADTRTLRARLGQGPAVDLRWSGEAKASVGELEIPADLAPGVHEIHVVAEDFAHNTSMIKLSITVLGN